MTNLKDNRNIHLENTVYVFIIVDYNYTFFQLTLFDIKSLDKTSVVLYNDSHNNFLLQ